MDLIEIESLEGNDDVSVYGSLTESQLRNRLHPENAIFIAESPKVIKVALQAGYRPLSILCEKKHVVSKTKCKTRGNKPPLSASSGGGSPSGKGARRQCPR